MSDASMSRYIYIYIYIYRRWEAILGHISKIDVKQN